MTSPYDIGSSGGASENGDGGHGGGSIYLNVSDSLEINGQIVADGQDESRPTNGHDDDGGGGSGGSVYIITNTLTGSGNITSDGGCGEYGCDAGTKYGGGGAGGRISIYYTSNSYSGPITTDGGLGQNNGGTGTTFICDNYPGMNCYSYGNESVAVETGGILHITEFTINKSINISKTILSSWTNLSLSWNDTSSNSSCKAIYNISGLNVSTPYYILDNDNEITESPITTDTNGILLFNRTLSSPHKIDVIVADETDVPIAVNVYPVDIVFENTKIIVLVYNVTSPAVITNCSLYVNGSYDQTNDTITKDVTQTFIKILDNGEYNWSVQCFDIFGREGNSTTSNFNISAYPFLTV